MGWLIVFKHVIKFKEINPITPVDGFIESVFFLHSLEQIRLCVRFDYFE